MESKTFRTLTPIFEELHGERVIVRPYCESDAQTLFEAVDESRDHIRPWLPFANAHQTVEESHDWIIHCMSDWLLREDFKLSIWEKTTGRFLGGTGLHVRDWDIKYFEIGYWLRASEVGKGYMTEAVRLLTTYALDEFGVNRLMIRCDARNVQSAAVAQRLGYVLEGRLRNYARAADGTLSTELIFSLIPTDRS